MHKKKKSGNGFGISYIRIAVSKDCSCACRLQFRQSSYLFIYLELIQGQWPVCRLCALMREGRADQIEELYRDRIKAIKTFRQQNYDIQDVISQVLMPEEFQNNFSAVKTKGDGNCLYNAAAMGIGGIFKSAYIRNACKVCFVWGYNSRWRANNFSVNSDGFLGRI